MHKTIMMLMAGSMLVFAGMARAASDQVTVPLPDLSDLSKAEAESLLTELAEINVITSNCPDYEIADSDWMLITGTGDKLAAQLGLDPTAYEREYYGPAFALLDDSGACDRVGPKAKPLIAKLESMGGGEKAGD